MATVYWQSTEPASDQSGAGETNEQHPLPVGLYWPVSDVGDLEIVNPGHPLPVAYPDLLTAVTTPLRSVGPVALVAAAAGDYAAGDAISNSVTDTNGRPVYVGHLARTVGGAAIIAGVRCSCLATNGLVVAAIRLYFFRYSPAPADVEMDDNIAFTIAGINGRDILAGNFLMNNFADRGGVSFSDTTGLQEPMRCAPNDDGLYMLPVWEGAEANESASMVFTWEFFCY